MANLFDYVFWRGDLDFEAFPFNPVDNVVFSQLSYLPMDGIVPGPGEKGSVSIAQLAKLYAEKLGAENSAQKDAPKDIMAEAASAVLSAIGAAPRYMRCEISGYVNRTDHDEEMQFSAFCAEIGGKSAAEKLLVVYRGTDASFVGWKEDFNMSFVNSVPAQKEAALYLDEAAGRFSRPLILAGHSKGGNLAIYAAAFCGDNTRRRIEAVYSNDAPGFFPAVIQSDGYQAICSRIRAFVPQSSFVGMLFEHGESPQVVKSAAMGLFQHNMCNWEVAPNNLSVGEELTPQSQLVSSVIHEWMGKLGEQQRHKFTEALYKILVSSNANSFIDIGSDWPHAAAGIIGGLKNIDGPTKKLMGETLGELFKTAKKNIIGRHRQREEELWNADLLNEE